MAWPFQDWKKISPSLTLQTNQKYSFLVCVCFETYEKKKFETRILILYVLKLRINKTGMDRFQDCCKV